MVHSPMIHTNGWSRLTVWAQPTLAPNHADSGPANACASPTAPKAMPTITIMSARVGIRSCCAR